MPTLSVSISEELKHKMEQMDEINWSAVARKAFEEKVIQIDMLQKIANKSMLTQKDADEISDKINKSMSKKFRSRNI